MRAQGEVGGPQNLDAPEAAGWAEASPPTAGRGGSGGATTALRAFTSCPALLLTDAPN